MVFKFINTANSIAEMYNNFIQQFKRISEKGYIKNINKVILVDSTWNKKRVVHLLVDYSAV